jgi:Ca2+-transporting ATPase
VWSALANLSLFVWASGSGRTPAEAMTMTFVSLVLIQFLKAYGFRSDVRSLLDRPFANRWLNLAILWEIAVLLTVVYLPVLQEPFGTFSLTIFDWAVVLGVSLTIVPVLEITKRFTSRDGR